MHPSSSLPLPISPLALGTWALAGDKFWGAQAEADSIATIHAALDAGLTLLDTAPLYGDGLSEEIVAKPSATAATARSSPPKSARPT